MDKYVPMSPQRVTNIIVTLDDVIIDFTGVPKENFHFTFERNNRMHFMSATFTDTRFIRYSLNHLKIWHDKF